MWTRSKSRVLSIRSFLFILVVICCNANWPNVTVKSVFTCSKYLVIKIDFFIWTMSMHVLFLVTYGGFFMVTLSRQCHHHRQNSSRFLVHRIFWTVGCQCKKIPNPLCVFCFGRPKTGAIEKKKNLVLTLNLLWPMGFLDFIVLWTKVGKEKSRLRVGGKLFRFDEF